MIDTGEGAALIYYLPHFATYLVPTQIFAIFKKSYFWRSEFKYTFTFWQLITFRKITMFQNMKISIRLVRERFFNLCTLSGVYITTYIRRKLSLFLKQKNYFKIVLRNSVPVYFNHFNNIFAHITLVNVRSLLGILRRDFIIYI